MSGYCESNRFERIRRQGVRGDQKGFSLLELMVTVSVIMIISAIAIPNLMRGKINANEAVALSSMRALNQACSAYWMEHYAYPASLADLDPGSASAPASLDLAGPELVSGYKSGYTFSYKVTSVDSSGRPQSYAIVADPVSRGYTGERGFYADDSGPIRVNPTGMATSASPPAD
jgi:prepilin-type N-terminal cleavage/methylation domain-containing protein